MREMTSTLAWRDNKIKALEAQRDYFQKQAQAQIALVIAQRAANKVYPISHGAQKVIRFFFKN